jgi:hypothetical protein
MKATVKSHRISYVIYPFDLLVSFHKNYSELEKELMDILPQDVHGEISSFNTKEKISGRTIMFSSGQTCIWFRVLSHQNIAHEVFHAVEFLMDKIDVRLSRKSDEAYAYMIGYITNEIYDVIK